MFKICFVSLLDFIFNFGTLVGFFFFFVYFFGLYFVLFFGGGGGG